MMLGSQQTHDQKAVRFVLASDAVKPRLFERPVDRAKRTESSSRSSLSLQAVREQEKA